jgi:diguanylate cyclase (GGDEF)-like protein
MTPAAGIHSSAQQAGMRHWAWHAVERKEEALCPSQLRGCLMALVDATPGLVMVSDRKGQLMFMNYMGRNMLGIAHHMDIATRSAFDLYTPASRDVLLREAIPQCLASGSWRGELTLRDAKGGEIPVSQVLMTQRVHGGEPVLSSIAWDIREMKQVEDQLRHQATHDALTGLPNRAHLLQRLEESLRAAEWNQSQVALLFVDMDGFKQVNDTHGHEFANRLLCAFGQRLKARVRSQDLVARYGGDEFVLMFNDLGSQADIASVVEQVKDAISEPFSIDQQVVPLAASVGLAVYPRDGRDVQTLLIRADADMYRHKEHLKIAS